MKTFVVDFLLFSAMLLLSSAVTADQSPIRIGASLGLTGKYAEFGKMSQLGYQLWEAQINQKGGILGRPVQLMIRDDKSSKDTAKEIYEDFIVREKVDFVFCPFSSDITEAIASITESYAFPLLASGASSDELWKKGYQNVFGIVPPASRRPIGFLALLDGAALRRIAIVGFDDSSSIASAESIKRWASDYNLQIVDQRTLPIKDPDMVAAARAVKQAGAQAVLVAGHIDEAVAMRCAFKQINWMPAAYYGANGPALVKYQEILGADAEGSYSTSSWEARDDLRITGAVEFIKAFRARYNLTPTSQAANAYAAGQVLEQAIRKAGTLKHNAVRDALFFNDIITITGRYIVDHTGVPTKGFPLIVQWQKGKREIVWPEELQTAKPIFSK